MRNRIKYSQNFLKDFNLVNKLISLAKLTKFDFIVEIGAGNGIITSALSSRVKSVTTYEIDTSFFNQLKNKFEKSNVKLVNKDFLDSKLPVAPYKVFSNIPFNITADIIRKLLLSDNSPIDTFLILQKEAALKFIGKPFDDKNSLIAVLLYPWFESKIIYKFSHIDFHPKPNVEIILANFKKREVPLIEIKDKENYFDFVAYIFNQYKPKMPGNMTQGELDFNGWLKLFGQNLNQITKFRGTYKKLVVQQQTLEKINRTR